MIMVMKMDGVSDDGSYTGDNEGRGLTIMALHRWR